MSESKITLQDLLRRDAVVDALHDAFDFHLLEVGKDDHEQIKLRPDVPFQIIASKGSGGVYLVYGDGPLESLPVLHATSEGQSGRVASNLTELLGILVKYPYWEDLLRFSDGGKLEEMRKAVEPLERERLEFHPDLPELRRMILEELAIPLLADPIKTLHENVHATDVTLVNDEGREWESLIGNSTSGDLV